MTKEERSAMIKKGWITRKKNGNDKPWNKGIKRPEFEGKDNPNWAGGSKYYVKQKALERDEYKCQKCGFKDIQIMCVDHILPKSIYPELALDINNLQTLCPNCHARKTLNDRKNFNN